MFSIGEREGGRRSHSSFNRKDGRKNHCGASTIEAGRGSFFPEKILFEKKKWFFTLSSKRGKKR